MPRRVAANCRRQAWEGDNIMRDDADGDYWRERARLARAQAVARRDVEGRRALLHIAENYEQLAEQTERIRKTRDTPIEP
jgi:hypothetical protein